MIQPPIIANPLPDFPQGGRSVAGFQPKQDRKEGR